MFQWRTKSIFGMACSALVVVLAAQSGCGDASNLDPRPQTDVAARLRLAAVAVADTSGAAAVVGTGWGSIKGVFTVDAAPPAAGALKVDKDLTVCGLHPLLDESLVVDSATKGLANVVLFVRTKNVRVNPELEAALPKQVFLDNKACHFEPHVVALWGGKQTLAVKNSDTVGHNTNISPPGEAGINPLLAPGATSEASFRRSQNSGVSATCNIHPWMKGYVIIRDNPYFAVTATDGSFELKSVPAGEKLEIEVWHEKAGGGVQLAEGKVKLSKSRFTITVPADGVEDLGTLIVPLGILK